MKPGIYHEVIARQVEGSKQTSEQSKTTTNTSPADDALLAQAKMEWLQSPRTTQIFKQISTQIEELESRARQLAVAYHVHNNHNEIIALLIRANELRNFKENYGR